MPQNHIYEVIKMNLLIVFCDVEKFHALSSGLTGTVVRWMLKTSKFWRSNLSSKCPNEPIFWGFQNLARDSARQAARMCLKVLGVEIYDRSDHFDYLICGVYMRWWTSTTNHNVPPLSVRFWTALFFKLWRFEFYSKVCEILKRTQKWKCAA